MTTPSDTHNEIIQLPHVRHYGFFSVLLPLKTGER